VDSLHLEVFQELDDLDATLSRRMRLVVVIYDTSGQGDSHDAVTVAPDQALGDDVDLAGMGVIDKAINLILFVHSLP